MKNSELAPVILFVYKRLQHTVKTVEALKNNELAGLSHLIVFSDGPKNENDAYEVKKIRSYMQNIEGFKTVRLFHREENLGLSKSILTGVTQIFEEFDRVIVLEDDMVSSKDFLTYMNSALEFYRNDRKIFAISGYNYPIAIPEDYSNKVFIGYRGSPWGWGMWKNRWEIIDWNVKDLDDFKKDKKAQRLFNRGGDDLTGNLIRCIEEKLDIWSIIRSYAQFRAGAYTLYPTKSKIKNIGLDGTGENCGITKALQVRLEVETTPFSFPEELKINEEINSGIKKLFPAKRKISLKKIINFLNYSNKNN